MAQPTTPTDSRLKAAWWHCLQTLCFLVCWLCYGIRKWGAENVPREGPVLIVSNHQSFLDPAIVGIGTFPRRFHALARSGLFTNPFFGWLIRSLNAIPVEQGQSDIGAMRRCIAALKQEHALLIFPEGARTPDGATLAFEPGTLLLIRRSGATVLPVAIEGAFDVWPRHRTWPRLHGRIGVMFGRPIPASAFEGMCSDEAAQHLQQIVEAMRGELAERLARRAKRRTTEPHAHVAGSRTVYP